MAVIRKRIERDIAHHADIKVRVLDRPDGAAHQVVGVYGFRPLGILERRVGRREDGDDRNAELCRLAGLIHQRIHRMPPDAGQGRYIQPRFRAVVDKDRPDEIRRGKHVFRDKAPVPIVPPVPPHTGDRKFS